MTHDVRRLFYALGAANYHADRQLAPLAGVEEDLIRMTELFTREFAYEPRPSEPFLDRAAEEVRTHLVSPGDEPFTEADTVVVYYAGHGEHIGDRHYLMCPDSRRGKPTSTALPTEDLVRIFTERNVRRLLLVVDTCYAARGAADAIREVAHQVALNMGRQNEAFNGRLVSFSIISAARKYQRAADSAFRTALESAIESGECGGIRSRKLLLETVVEVVSEKLKEQGHDQQDATLATLLTDRDDPPFLPNPRYDPDAPPESVSVAELRNWSRSALPPKEKRAAAASCFTGRNAALQHLRAWVFDTEDTSRPLAVTGAPGTGKTALLTEFRRLLEAETGGPGPLPPVTVVLVDARDKSRADIVREVATAEGVAPESHYDALKTRLRPFILLVDAVGEAPETAGSPGPGEIVELLKDLAELPTLRVITAVPSALLTDLGPGDRLDLDDPRWDSEADLHACATRLLLHPDGPGGEAVRSADEASRQAAAIVAGARGNRLLIRLLAQYRPETADRTPSADPPTIGQVFREALRARCSDDREFTTMAALLSGLAFSHGAGLPWGGRLWPRVMAKVFNNGEPLRSRDVRRLLDVAGPFLVETLDSAGRTVYRLYHETFAEELRATAPARAREDIAAALREELKERYREQSDRPVDPYLRTRLPAHAADAGAVRDLLQDPWFVATTDSATIRWLLNHEPAAWREAQAALDFVKLRDRGQDGITDLQLLWAVASVWESRTMLLRLVLEHELPLDRFSSVVTIGCTGPVRYGQTTTEDGQHTIVVESSTGTDLVVEAVHTGTQRT
ncbi:caspase family protein [Streptomyces sp. NPDC058464]|uniref:caspase family protein n=1 Tax=Streptomyces sp. NPDC058464 TaxID=3346511 RepID=UPI00365F84FF